MKRTTDSSDGSNLGHLRQRLPYGAVMATAGAAVLAARCGLQNLVAPWLALAVIQALWIPASGALRHRATLRRDWLAWLTIGSADEHAGIHTVPLGIAVIAGGFAWLSASGAAPWLLSPVASACLGLTWLLAIVCVGRFLRSLALRGLALERMDGTWFLVPASLLGAAIAAKNVVALVHGRSAPILAEMALLSALLGWLGYWAVAAVTLVRLRRFGLGGVPQAPWWIAMGCAGLAAAALGNVLDVPTLSTKLQAILVAAMTATDIFAVALWLPVIVGSVRFMLRQCRFRLRASWTPTFSTAVLSLGCLQTGGILHSQTFRSLGTASAYVTFALWAVTVGWDVRHACINHFTRRRGKGS